MADQDKLGKRVAAAIYQVRAAVRWKPGKGIVHLHKRISLGHLPPEATPADYEVIITTLVQDPLAEVYVYVAGETSYPAVVGEPGGRRWIVIFSMTGVIETAFPPLNPDHYLSDERFVRLGRFPALLRPHVMPVPA